MKKLIAIGNDIILESYKITETRYGNKKTAICFNTLSFLPKNLKKIKNIKEFTDTNYTETLINKGFEAFLERNNLKKQSDDSKPPLIKDSYFNEDLINLCANYFAQNLAISSKPDEICAGIPCRKVPVKRESFLRKISAKNSFEDLLKDFTRYKNIELIRVLKNFIKESVIPEGKYFWEHKKTVGKKKYNVLSYYVGFDTEYKDFMGFNYKDIDVIADNGDKGNSNDYRLLEFFKQNESKQLLVSTQMSRKITDEVFLNTFIVHCNGDRFSYNKLMSSVESKIMEYSPIQAIFDVTLISHKNIVDLTKMDGLRLSYVKSKVLSINNCLITKVNKGIRITEKMKGDNTRNRFLRGILNFRDSLTLQSPMSLAKLGRQLEFYKFELEAGVIENMDKYWIDNPNEFYIYAMRDAQISVEFLYKFFGNMKYRVPVTIASLAAEKLKMFLMDKYGFNKEMFDLMFRGKFKISASNNYFSKKATRESNLICANNYYGGRNETFWHGLFQGFFQDVDMSKFYPMLASLIPFLDMNEAPDSIKTGIMTEHTLNPFVNQVGMAQVDFDFTKVKGDFLPCITVKTPVNGLIFPLKGKGVWVSLQELKTAYSMGCKINILNGFIYKTIPQNGFPLGEFFKELAKEREKAVEDYGKGSPEEQLIKLIMNSVTGKLGQGITSKTSYDIFLNENVPITESTISNPAYVMTITSTGRAVISETMNLFIKLKIGEIVNVVTDGFVLSMDKFRSDRELNDIIVKEAKNNYQKYPNLALYLNQLESQGFKVVVETKHQGTNVMPIKTRINLLWGDDFNEKKTQISMVGYKENKAEAEMSLKEKILHYKSMIIEREGRIENNTISLYNARKFNRDSGENSKAVVKRLNFNYDFKRDIDYKTICYNQKMFSFKTVPYESEEMFQYSKDKFESNKDIAIKSIDDINKINLVEDLRVLPIQFRKDYTAKQILNKLICALARCGIIKYRNKILKTVDDIVELSKKLKTFDMDDKFVNKNYFRRQKITESQKEKFLQADNIQLIENTLNEYYITDGFKISS